MSFITIDPGISLTNILNRNMGVVLFEAVIFQDDQDTFVWQPVLGILDNTRQLPPGKKDCVSGAEDLTSVCHHDLDLSGKYPDEAMIFQHHLVP